MTELHEETDRLTTQQTRHMKTRNQRPDDYNDYYISSLLKKENKSKKNERMNVQSLTTT